MRIYFVFGPLCMACISAITFLTVTYIPTHTYSGISWGGWDLAFFRFG